MAIWVTSNIKSMICSNFYLTLSREAAHPQQRLRHGVLVHVEYVQWLAIGSMVEGDTQAPKDWVKKDVQRL